MTENPNWLRRVQHDTPQWGERSFLQYGVLKGIQLIGSSGRPLRENDGYNPARVRFEQGSAIQDGGREGKSVNKSAFVEVSGAYDDALGLISHIRHSLLPYGREVTPDGIRSVISAVQGLPYWLVMKADNPMQNGNIPTYITAAAKVAEGASKTYTVNSFAEIGIGKKPKKGSAEYKRSIRADTYVKDIFNRHFLVSETMQGEKAEAACPAPWQLVMDLAEVLFNEPSAKKDEMGTTLGLSVDKIHKVSKFGVALHKAKLLDRYLYNLATHERSSGAFWQGDMPARIDGRRINFLEYAVDEISFLETQMNEALGRQTAPPSIPAAFGRRQ